MLGVGAAVEFLRVLISPEGGGVEHQHGVGGAGEHQLSGVAALGPVQGTWGVKYFHHDYIFPDTKLELLRDGSNSCWDPGQDLENWRFYKLVTE